MDDNVEPGFAAAGSQAYALRNGLTAHRRAPERARGGPAAGHPRRSGIFQLPKADWDSFRNRDGKLAFPARRLVPRHSALRGEEVNHGRRAGTAHRHPPPGHGPAYHSLHAVGASDRRCVHSICWTRLLDQLSGRQPEPSGRKTTVFTKRRNIRRSDATSCSI